MIPSALAQYYNGLSHVHRVFSSYIINIVRLRPHVFLWMLALPPEAVDKLLASLVATLRKTGTVTHQDFTTHVTTLAAKLSLKTLPSLTDIARHLRPNQKQLLAKFLLRKPIRSASGVQVIAVMCKPHRCPHQVKTGSSCTYCGGGPDSDFEYSSQSYTGFEPTSMRAIRARYNPTEQVRVRMEQLRDLGHSSNKIEIVLMGGTFLSTPRPYRDFFVSGIYSGLTGHIVDTTSLSYTDKPAPLEDSAAIVPALPKKAYMIPESICYASRSSVKCVALTIETRPDYCEPRHLADMLRYGTTRLEIGVQSVYDDVIADINRGHTVKSVIRCFGQSKDAGFKLITHMMPNLVFTSTKRDLYGFKELFESIHYRPDGMKIYPTLIIRGTPLYERWRTGRYLRTLETTRLVYLLAMIFAIAPPWLRIYRIMRDIPLPLITTGVESANLRELALANLSRLNRQSLEIRNREAGVIDSANEELKRKTGNRLHRNREEYYTPEVTRRDYWSSGGWETFLSIESPTTVGTNPPTLYGLCRLRQIPRGGRGKYLGIRKELQGDVSLIREVHVYGSAAGVSDKGASVQHRGYGRILVAEAERISRCEHHSGKLAIISGVGTREYYAKLGYSLDGPYMSRILM